MGSYVTIPTKLTGETLPVRVNFLSQLAAGEAVTAVVCTATVLSGTDATPSAILSGSGTLAANVFTQILTAGVAGTTYLLTFTATTNSTNYLIINAVLVVISTTPYVT